MIKTMLKSLTVFKVYLQCAIIIQHGLPSVQLSHMMNLKIKFAKNKHDKCLDTICSTEMIQIA